MNSALHFQAANQRSEPRKTLRCAATMLFKRFPASPVRTIDVSTTGMAVMAPHTIAEGDVCGISFQAFVNDDMVQINAVGRVVYCICVGMQGFRIGLEFTEVEPAGKIALAQLAG